MTSFKLFVKKNKSMLVTIFLLLGLGSTIACIVPTPPTSGNDGGNNQPTPLATP